MCDITMIYCHKLLWPLTMNLPLLWTNTKNIMIMTFMCTYITIIVTWYDYWSVGICYDYTMNHMVPLWFYITSVIHIYIYITSILKLEFIPPLFCGILKHYHIILAPEYTTHYYDCQYYIPPLHSTIVYHQYPLV